jgi:hypothetical protein
MDYPLRVSGFFFAVGIAGVLAIAVVLRRDFFGPRRALPLGQSRILQATSDLVVSCDTLDVLEWFSLMMLFPSQRRI